MPGTVLDYGLKQLRQNYFLEELIALCLKIFREVLPLNISF